MLLLLLLLLLHCCAGGVAVSGLEMAQNATMTTWSSADVDTRLKVSVGMIPSSLWVVGC
jgi:glutamate dehydrogenase/leucine dehydrogenase